LAVHVLSFADRPGARLADQVNQAGHCGLEQDPPLLSGRLRRIVVDPCLRLATPEVVEIKRWFRILSLLVHWLSGRFCQVQLLTMRRFSTRS
jgi:hypothetical protein